MSVVLPDADYAIRVVKRNDGYELQIPGLLLSVRAGDLQRGYDELMKRKQEVIEWARLLGALDDLPRRSPTETILIP